jgi:hypothetical protein
MPKHKRRGRKARSSRIGIRVTVGDTTDIRATLEVRKARKARKALERKARKARKALERKASKARKARERAAREARVTEVREAREASDDEDDVPILDLVRRSDAEWRAPGRGRVYEIHKIVDWKIDAPLSHDSRQTRSIFFLVWWKGYALRESTWEPASGIHPVEQVRFFKAAGVFD